MFKRTPSFLALAAILTASTVASAQVAPATEDSIPLSPAARNVLPSSTLPPAVSTNDPRPPAPSPIIGKRLALVHQAGIGGPVSYARGGVLEFGGHLAFLNGHQFTSLSVSPQIGFFLTNNFELSVLATVSYDRNLVSTPEGSVIPGNNTGTILNNAASVVAVVEPSIHLPLADHLFVFGGLGAGVAYHKNAKSTVGFALAPRVGFDIMVGRSGVLTPAFNLNWSTNSSEPKTLEDGTTGRLVAVRTLIGASIGYKVMF